MRNAFSRLCLITIRLVGVLMPVAAVASVWLAAPAASAPPGASHPPIWQVYAIRYATIPKSYDSL